MAFNFYKINTPFNSASKSVNIYSYENNSTSKYYISKLMIYMHILRNVYTCFLLFFYKLRRW